MTSCRRSPVVFMRFFYRCEHHCKILLFFYQFVSANLMSKEISNTAVKQYVPLDTNHYLQVVLQACWLLSLRFFFFSSNLFPFKWKPTDRKACNRDSSSDWRDISSFTRKWSWWKMEVNNRPGVSLSLSICPFIRLSVSDCLFVCFLVVYVQKRLK